MQKGLRDRWQILWSKVSDRGKGMIPYADLISRYSEPWRAYHILAHIREMLEELEDFGSSAKFREVGSVDPSAIEMAIWYHDAVYNTQAKDNEERSAQLFRAMAKRYHLGAHFTELVAQLIMATKHANPPEELNAQVLCDIDLAVFGKPKRGFERYEDGIREEYNWVPNAQFNEGRIAILRSFLGWESIYATEFFRSKYEQQARKNLTRSITQLEVSLGRSDIFDGGESLQVLRHLVGED